MEVVAPIKRAKQPWCDRPGELQGELVCFHAGEDIHKILRVKRNCCPFPFNLSLNVCRVIANICGGGDVNCSTAFRCNRESHDVR